MLHHPVLISFEVLYLIIGLVIFIAFLRHQDKEDPKFFGEWRPTKVPPQYHDYTSWQMKAVVRQLMRKTEHYRDGSYERKMRI